MGNAILRALGRGLLALVRGIWEAICLPVLHAIGGAIAAIIRRLAPWVIGGGIFIWLIYNRPEVANQLLTLAILIGVVYAMWRFIIRGGSRKERRTR